MSDLAEALNLLQFGSTDEQITACEVLAKHNLPASNQMLLDKLETEDPHVFKAVVDALVQTQDPRSVEAICKVFDQSDPWGIRHRIATTALGDLGEAAAVPVLSNLAATHHWERVREAAAIALGKIADKQAVASLLDLLVDADYAVQCAAAASLGKIGSFESTAGLCKAAAMEDHWGLRKEAALEALAAIKDPASAASLAGMLRHPSNTTVVIDSIIKALVAIGPASVGPMLEVAAHVDARSAAAIIEALHVLKETNLGVALTTALLPESNNWSELLAIANTGEIRFVSVLIDKVRQLAKPKSAIETRYKQHLQQTVKEIFSGSHVYLDTMYCRRDLSRFQSMEIADLPLIACRTCETTYYAQQILKVTAVLDKNAPAIVQTTQGLSVNWLINQTLFDFDCVEIGDTSDESVVRFCMMVANNTDGYLNTHDVSVAVKQPDLFQANSLRILDKTFGK